MADTSVFRLAPYSYIHVLDNNTNVTVVKIGPQTFTRQDHEKVVKGPEQCITIPPRSYCIIANPVVRDADGAPTNDEFGQCMLAQGDLEVRLSDDWTEPFPLYPGESLQTKVTPLEMVPVNSGLRLRATRDLSSPVKRVAGEEWIFEGPGTYVPVVGVEKVELVRATVIKPNVALKLRARKAFTDPTGAKRNAGELWLWRQEGAYLPAVDEEVVEKVEAFVLTEKRALHLRATHTFTDAFGRKRQAGEEWLVTINDAETHIPDVCETVVTTVDIVSLNNRQYAVILDPVVDGVTAFGQKSVRVGEASFFLHPGERLESGIQDVFVLSEEQALLLRAKEAFVDGEKERAPGDMWMKYGPSDYVPPVEVEVVAHRKAIPLDENEGLYVRDIKTGKVRSVIGQTYMLEPSEELWKKELPATVEELLAKDVDPSHDRTAEANAIANKRKAKVRDKTRVVTFRVPHNAAVQVYDYKEKKARVCFGPDLVMLNPDEQFTVLSLSGGKPKRGGAIKSLALLLGPDFMTDIVTVETADHARLSLQLSYNWQFDIVKSNPEHASAIFQVPDFVGDTAKVIASRVRSAVAKVSFDNFHRNSSKIIRTSVFGIDEAGKVNAQFSLPANRMQVTNIDIQSVEPVDQRTRDALQRSVQLAIEITTKSQEAAARHQAEQVDQKARGTLERQKIADEADAERARKDLLVLQADSAAVESTGHAVAEAKAKVEALAIEGETDLKQAQLRADAKAIESSGELAQRRQEMQAALAHKQRLLDLELAKAKELAQIEVSKFQNTIDAIGAETIKKIARAGPENQAKLLAGLGIKNFLITDGSNPINLFQSANGVNMGAQQ